MKSQQAQSILHAFRGTPRAARIVATVCFSLAMAARAGAVSVAVLGNNLTDDTINTVFGAGSATLVSDAQIATPGFLAAFDALYVTRNGADGGTGLSAAAAAEVVSYVGISGNVVLLVGDYADALGFSGPADPNIVQLTTNAVSYAAASGNGFIGEYNGAAMGFTSNLNGFIPLGFVPGASTGLTCCPADGNVDFTQPLHPVASGLPDPILNPDDLEFGSGTTGVPAVNVIARYVGTGDVAIAVRAGIPEPASLALMSLGLLGITSLARRSRC